MALFRDIHGNYKHPKGLYRGIVFMLFAGALIVALLMKIDAPEWFIALSSSVFSFYFGSRTANGGGS